MTTRWEFNEDEISRILPLDGAYNFRDVRDYRTRDGRKIGAHRLYRSAGLHKLTDADHDYLTSLNIRHIVDLRSTSEREKWPSRWIPGSEAIFWSRSDNQAEGDLTRLLATGESDPEAYRQAMFTVYRRLPIEMADAFSYMLRQLAEGGLPILIHCAVGKDRTGVALALVLLLLGVDEKTVMDDYLLTNASYDRAMIRFSKNYAAMDLNERAPGVMPALMGAHPEYLRAALGQMIEDHGTIENYAIERLGLTPEELNAMRDNLLEPA